MANIGPKHYHVRAQQKVGRQNIGKILAVNFGFGVRAELIARMKREYPNARVDANAHVFAREEEIKAYYRGRGVLVGDFL